MNAQRKKKLVKKAKQEEGDKGKGKSWDTSVTFKPSPSSSLHFFWSTNDTGGLPLYGLYTIDVLH